jgi:hypothetical protein
LQSIQHVKSRHNLLVILELQSIQNIISWDLPLTPAWVKSPEAKRPSNLLQYKGKVSNMNALFAENILIWVLVAKLEVWWFLVQCLAPFATFAAIG